MTEKEPRYMPCFFGSKEKHDSYYWVIKNSMGDFATLKEAKDFAENYLRKKGLEPEFRGVSGGK